MQVSSKSQDLSPTEVSALLKRDEIVLVDVREPAEYAAERIHGALNFPLSTFDPQALPSGGETVVLQCGTGKRSGMALERCRDAGVLVESHLAGGISAWIKAGLPTIRFDPDTGGVVDRG